MLGLTTLSAVITRLQQSQKEGKKRHFSLFPFKSGENFGKQTQPNFTIHSAKSGLFFHLQTKGSTFDSTYDSLRNPSVSGLGVGLTFSDHSPVLTWTLTVFCPNFLLFLLTILKSYFFKLAKQVSIWNFAYTFFLLHSHLFSNAISLNISLFPYLI